jgi:OmpA-OmpF porin, OOP family
MDVKVWLVVWALMIVVGHTAGQNLVGNSSFEEKRYCPANFNQTKMNYIVDWQQPTDGTPDYFHTCSRKAGAPSNLFGYQVPFAGEAYAGLVTFSSKQPEYREYLQINLDRPLRAGELVCVEVHISPADQANYVTDGFGLFFSDYKPEGSNNRVLDLDAQITNPEFNLIDEYTNWMKISDSFVAVGGEKYLTIGNFKLDRDLTVLHRTRVGDLKEANDWSYLYVDDVVVKSVVSRDECSCVNDIIRETVHNPPLELNEVRELELHAVLFDFDKDLITENTEKELKRVVKTMMRNTLCFLEIEGHTDIIGGEEYNIDLSRRRAEAVIDYLVDQGVDPRRLQIAWVGSVKPVADNESDEGRAQNRRVEFKILEKVYTLYSK